MNVLYGLQARFIAVISLAMIVVVAVVTVMWQRQNTMQTEVLRLNQDAMRTLVHERLRDRGEAQVTQAAELLANPLYYFDLDAIGNTTRSILHQPGVSYVLVYNGKGDIIHDGSGDIPSYGQAMRDPLAARIVKADDVLVLTHSGALDVSMPIKLGDQRLGGVRVGYSLSKIRAEETHIGQQMGRMLGEIGSRYLTWIALLLLSLLGLFVIVGIVLQRTLVRPIRQLSTAASEIESGNFATRLPAPGRADEVGTLIDAFSRMSDSIVRHDRDMRRMAYTDALTGLSNRLAFREALDHRLMELRGVGRQLALLFADIDDFKRVNDTLGHDVGDEVLVQCANRIREAVDRLAGGAAQLARFGGDEFVILLHADAEHTGDVRIAATQLAEH
ncbi:MAG: diguanylate cyclase, partial [Lysobacter sp.]|nr:diguanylate cyclase [Lysobacter sp.]